jgi:hypothetical protein
MCSNKNDSTLAVISFVICNRKLFNCGTEWTYSEFSQMYHILMIRIRTNINVSI